MSEHIVSEKDIFKRVRAKVAATDEQIELLWEMTMKMIQSHLNDPLLITLYLPKLGNMYQKKTSLNWQIKKIEGASRNFKRALSPESKKKIRQLKKKVHIIDEITGRKFSVYKTLPAHRCRYYVGRATLAEQEEIQNTTWKN